MLHKTELIEYHGEARVSWESGLYDPGIDQYFHAEIIEISKDQIVGYQNAPGSRYLYFPSDITLIDSMIIITDEYFDYEQEAYVTYQDTGYYTFEGSLLLLIQDYDEGDYPVTQKLFFKKYTGKFPPKSWTTPLANDQYEPDDIVQNAKPVTVGGDAQIHTLTQNDWDWFKFTAEAGKTYLITVTGYMDNVLALYEPDGQTGIAEDDDNDWNIPVPGNVESVLVWDCPVAGVYFYRVIAYFSQDVGYYTTAVQLTNLDSPLLKLEKPVQGKKEKAGHMGFRKRFWKN